MKKFLKKKGVRIGLVVAAVVMLAMVLYFCIRPVSVGFTYSATKTIETTEYKNKYHFDSFRKVTFTRYKNGEEESKRQAWYYVEDGKLRIVGYVDGIGSLTEEQFKEAKENDRYLVEADINAFQIGANEEDPLTSVGAIVLVSILGAIELVLIGFAAASVILNVKKK